MQLPISLSSPTLQTEESETRHATWLELFFDLVFVVAIAELSHDLAGDVTPIRLLGFVGLFVPIFLLWMNFSYYADLFGEVGLDRVGLFTAMFGVSALATTLHDALAGSITNFVLVYLLLRVVLVGLYARAWRATPDSRRFLGTYVGLYGVSALLWAVSLLFAGPVQFVVVGLAIAVEVATPATAYYSADDHPQQVSHMPERFGLFTIIVLGEVVVAVVSGLADAEWSLAAVTASVLAFLLAVGLWHLYFAMVRESTITDILRSEELDFFAGMGYTYGHFGITLGITAGGVGALSAILAVADGTTLTLPVRLTLGGGLAVYLLGTALTHGSVRALARQHTAGRIAVAVVAVALAALVASPLLAIVGCCLLVGALALTERVTLNGSTSETV